MESASDAGLPSTVNARTVKRLSSTSPGTSAAITSHCSLASPVTVRPAPPPSIETWVSRYARAPSSPVTAGWKMR